jgi:hypothetical protein
MSLIESTVVSIDFNLPSIDDTSCNNIFKITGVLVLRSSLSQRSSDFPITILMFLQVTFLFGIVWQSVSNKINKWSLNKWYDVFTVTLL